MFEIKKEIAEKYSILPLKQYLDDFGNSTVTYRTYLETFLYQTQDIENQAMSYVLNGETVPVELQEIINLKKQVRAELEKLKNEEV